MKRAFPFLFFLFYSAFAFSQVDSDSSSITNNVVDTVIICMSQEAKSFHSDNRCIGLDLCKDSLLVVSDVVAMEKFERKACCICWENVENDCVNDNPDAYEEVEYDGQYDDPDDEVYVEDWLWLADFSYYFLGVAIGSVVLLSNEVYIGTSHSYFPPNLSDFSRSKYSPSLGIDILFRKNLKRDAFEYGFSFNEYKWVDERFTPSEVDNQTSYMFSLSYLHELNRHFSTISDPALKLKFYVGPLFTFGYSEDNFSRTQSEFGVGGTMVLSLPLGKRFHVDLRNEITNYSAGVKLGIRWLYQKKYPWQKNRN